MCWAGVGPGFNPGNTHPSFPFHCGLIFCNTDDVRRLFHIGGHSCLQFMAIWSNTVLNSHREVFLSLRFICNCMFNFTDLPNRPSGSVIFCSVPISSTGVPAVVRLIEMRSAAEAVGIPPPPALCAFPWLQLPYSVHADTVYLSGV